MKRTAFDYILPPVISLTTRIMKTAPTVEVINVPQMLSEGKMCNKPSNQEPTNAPKIPSMIYKSKPPLELSVIALASHPATAPINNTTNQCITQCLIVNSCNIRILKLD